MSSFAVGLAGFMLPTHHAGQRELMKKEGFYAEHKMALLALNISAPLN